MRWVAAILLCLSVAGCGARRAPAAGPASQPEPATGPSQTARPPQDSLETFMAKVRKLAAEARPQRPAPATIEGSDPRLAAAIAASRVAPSPATLRAAGAEYARLKIWDRAHEYLMRALAADSRDASTYDALARLWRDGGFPHLGLGDAYRARYYAPASPVVHNTLGTLFQAMGRRADARLSYERALRLDPGAAYALNNICYGWVLEGQARKAIAACEKALQVQPTLVAAHNNLGLARAVDGDLQAARTAFADAAGPAAGLYNLGIAQLARRQYADALRSFRAAAAATPTLRVVQARIRQAEQLSRSGVDE